MKCPRCGTKLTLLFTSAVCDLCDPPVQNVQPTPVWSIAADDWVVMWVPAGFSVWQGRARDLDNGIRCGTIPLPGVTSHIYCGGRYVYRGYEMGKTWGVATGNNGDAHVFDLFDGPIP